MNQVKFVKDSLQKISSDMVCLGTPHHFIFFKGYLPQTLLGPFLNTFLNTHICGALRDLASFAQFKKREKHPWRSVNFSKLYKWYQIAQHITYISLLFEEILLRTLTRLTQCSISIPPTKPLVFWYFQRL